MSGFKPGWAEALGLAQSGDTEAHSRMRRRGQRPISENPLGSRFDKGRIASVKANHRSHNLERVLGPVKED